MTNHLIEGLLQVGIAVDLLLIKARGPYVPAIPPGARQIRLGSQHTFAVLPGLCRYLRAERPMVLIAVKHRALLVAALARRLCRPNTLLIGQIHTNFVSAMLRKNKLRRLLWQGSMRCFYPWADRVVGVSEGVASALREATGLSTQQVCTIYNPALAPSLLHEAAQPTTHPWFTDNGPPIILGAGRFTPQKNFSALIKAFHQIQQSTPCRLMILGEGPLLPACKKLAQELGLDATRVSFPGHCANPYPYMARARLFVLSSLWEGFGVVLVEALALGIPVVSTDCPSGPREILEDGRYGRLVQPNDTPALIQAITEALHDNIDRATLRAAAQRYSIPACVQQYLALFDDVLLHRG